MDEYILSRMLIFIFYRTDSFTFNFKAITYLLKSIFKTFINIRT